MACLGLYFKPSPSFRQLRAVKLAQQWAMRDSFTVYGGHCGPEKWTTAKGKYVYYVEDLSKKRACFWICWWGSAWSENTWAWGNEEGSALGVWGLFGKALSDQVFLLVTLDGAWAADRKCAGQSNPQPQGM